MSFDLVGLGSVAVDELLYVEAYPPADVKVRVAARESRCGGLIGVALHAAARLGARCAYAGRLATDDPSRRIEEAFVQAGIDVSHAPRSAEHHVVESTIIIATGTGTRNVFSNWPGNTGAHPSLPAAEFIRAARVLLVDHHGVAGSIRAARIARAAGVAIVADFERDDDPQFPQLLALADHLILSETFARRISGANSAHQALGHLWNRERATVVVTCGEDGCWVMAAGAEEPAHVPAMQVVCVDSTSCGDVFHGAYATALAQGSSLQKRLRFATVAAGLKATRRGGISALPTREEVDQCAAAWR